MSSSGFIILGAGNLGRRVARAVQPLAFCDNNSSVQGKTIEGLAVMSPKAAIEKYPEATFVVAIWHPSRIESMVDRMAQLQSLGARNVIPFTALFSQYGDSLLPHFLWERPDYYAAHEQEMARARALFDDAGRAEFDRQVRLRKGDHAGQVIDPGVQYFPDDLFRLGEDEIFIDCGAYNGDTIADFRHASGDRFSRVVAFEPDPANFTALVSAVKGDERIEVQPYATGLRRETLRLSMDDTGSHISDTGACVIEAIALDDVLADVEPTYIKFDIEGSEPDALAGGRRTIVSHRPKLAVCVYHAPDHLWSLPLQLNELMPDSRMTLRTYNADGLDCVCYCLPD